MPKILVIRFSSIGDIVLASPVLRCLKQQIPGAEIHFLTKETFKAVTIGNPYIDRFFYFSNGIDLVINELKKEDYDYVIDLHKNFRSLKVKRALRKKTFTIRKLSLEKFLLTKLDIDIMPNMHITTRSLETVLPLGVKDDGGGLDYFIPPEAIVPKSDLPHAHMAGFVAIVIGASYATKRLPAHKLMELCKKIKHPVILIGGKEDRATGDQIAAIDNVKIYNACGKFSLNESADLIRQAKLTVSHDTGMLYIACAFKKPAIAIWGATTPDLDVEPYYGKTFVAQQRRPPYENVSLQLGCQPCSKYGTETCPLGHFNCMEKQDIDAIVAKIYDRL